MTDRSALVRAIHEAADGRTLSQAVAALDQFDRMAAARHAADRELDLGAQMVAQRLEPVPIHEHHTAATDWLADFEVPEQDGYRTAMIAEASTWYSRLDPAVREDGQELAEQARGRARTVASAYGPFSGKAEREFLQTVGYLHQGASGLPQIDQTIDPNNQPSATPYPTEVFDNFAEEQDPFNGVETNNHQSGASSEGAPMLQQLQQQQGGGSGFGSGPERPDQHSTSMDTSDSYAEVPLGAPGVIPTSGPGQGPTAQSAPNPIDGVNQDAGSDRRHASVQGYSYPDAFGFRWVMTSEIMHPFHERCASAHWPDEECGDRSHTASVAIGYQMDLDHARRLAYAESVGAQEGLRAFYASRTLADLTVAHNRFAAAWGQSDRTAEDTAVLHGFLAVVRPVMAEMMPNHAGRGDGIQATAAGGLAAGGVTEQERADAPHHLPGTDKFPIGSAADVKSAEHDIGRTNEPHDKVVQYIDEMKKVYHTSGLQAVAASSACANCQNGDCQNCRGGACDCAKAGHKKHQGSRLDFPRAAEAALVKGAPFAGYKDFDDCVARNQDKGSPEAYCGEIKHRVEGSRRQAKVPSPACPSCHSHDVVLSRQAGKNTISCNGCGNSQPYAETADIMEHAAASGLTQVQQITDPNNAETPQDDDLPAGVAFPLNEAWTQQWITGPGGAEPKGATPKAEAAGMRGLPGTAARMFGRMDALEGNDPHHKDHYPFTSRAHGSYLRGWNENHAMLTAQRGTDPFTREGYTNLTGRGDLFPHWQETYDTAKRYYGMDTNRGKELGSEAARRVQADTWSQPHQSTDDLRPPYSQPDTNVPMHQDGGDYAAGAAAGKADKASGERPAFADNSSAVSPYVKGYAEAYGAASEPQGAQDVPYSMGGDSGQAMNAQEAQQAFQRAGEGRVSAAFAPESLMADPAFRKGYLFASKWRPGQRLVATGTGAFEAGLYAGVTDRPGIQQQWLAAHAALAGAHKSLAQRIALHSSFTAKTAGKKGLRAQGAYLVREAGVSTDLISDGPGTSPDPMGATPLNGPGTPPPMGGADNANAPGGAPPYQGAPPLPGGPVVPDDVMGRAQDPEQPSGPFTNTFSGNHPENADLAPVAPNSANEPGYSRKDVYQGDPRGGDRVAAFRQRVQAGLTRMASPVHDEVHRHLQRAKQAFQSRQRAHPHVDLPELSTLMRGTVSPRDLESILGDLVSQGRAKNGPAAGEWEASE